MSLKVHKFFNQFSPIQTCVTPFKTSIYLMIAKFAEIFNRSPPKDDSFSSSSPDDVCDKRSYYAVLLWTLIRGPEMSLPILKCFIFRYLNDFDNFFKEFILLLITYESKEVVPNNKEYFDLTSCKFLKPLSVLAFFTERFSEEYYSMSSTKQFQYSKEWENYVDSPASQQEIDKYSAEWKVDVNEMFVKVVELEELIKENFRRSKRNVFYNKPDSSTMEVD